MKRLIALLIILLVIPTADANILIRDPIEGDSFRRGEQVVFKVEFSNNGRILSGANVRAIHPEGRFDLQETLTGYEGVFTVPFDYDKGNWTFRIVGSTGEIEEEDEVTIEFTEANLKIEIINPGSEIEAGEHEIEVIVLYPNGEIGRGMKVNATGSQSYTLTENAGRYLGQIVEERDFKLAVRAQDLHGNFGSTTLDVTVFTKSVILGILNTVLFILPPIVVSGVIGAYLISRYQKEKLERLSRRKNRIEKQKKELEKAYFRGKIKQREMKQKIKTHEDEAFVLNREIKKTRSKTQTLKDLLKRRKNPYR